MYTTPGEPERSILWSTTLSWWLSDFQRMLEYRPNNRHLYSTTDSSKNATTRSIDLSYKKQHSSFASAEGVVPTQEYPSGSIHLTTTLPGWFFGLPSDCKVSFCSLPDQRLASTKVRRITKYKEWWMYPRSRTEEERTTLDFNREVTLLTSIQN